MRGQNAPALLGTQYRGTDSIKLYQLTYDIERVPHHGEDWQDKVKCRGEPDRGANRSMQNFSGKKLLKKKKKENQHIYKP